MWHDNETDKDFLGFVVHEQLIRNLITDDKNLPVTVGLYGEWGSGKSSILKILKKELEEDEKFKKDTIVVYFDGWTFEGYDDAKSALMQDIVKQVENNKSLSAVITDDVKEKAKEVYKSIKWLRVLKWSAANLVLPGVAAYATGGLALVPFLLEKLRENKDRLIEKINGEEGEKFLEDIISKNETELNFDTIRDFRNQFSNLINTTKMKRLVVLIDDLDRCSPQRIIDNLEAIKLFLNVEKTAFVIAADEEIVKNAVKSIYANAYDDKSKGSNLGMDYLDKLIQVPYTLPRLSTMEVETYINMLLCKSNLDNDDDFEKIRNKFQEFIREKKFGVFDWDKISPLIEDSNVRAKILPIATFMAPVSNIVASSMKGNPRLIKRFLNAYELRTKLLEVGGIDDQQIKLALLKLMIIEKTDENLFSQLYKWKDDKRDENIEQLEKLAENDNAIYVDRLKAWNTPFMRNLLCQSPKFTEVDMKTLFWATRATYGDSMSGLTLTSQNVRELIKLTIDPSTSDNMLKDTFVKRIQELMGNDLNDFFNLLDRQILSVPEQKYGYNVYWACITNDIEGSFERFKLLLNRIPTDKIPGAMGTKFKSIARKFPEDKVFKGFFSSDSEISRSMK